MEKLNRAQKCTTLGPQNLGSRGGLGPGPPGSAPVLAQIQEFLVLKERSSLISLMLNFKKKQKKTRLSLFFGVITCLKTIDEN